MVSSFSWSVLTVLALAGAGPVVDDVTTNGAIEDAAVGVVWYAEATGPSSIRQRLVDTVASAGRDPQSTPRVVLDRADHRARVAIAVELPRQQADTAVQLSRALDEATRRFREGDLPAADAAVAAVLDALGDDPLLPGVAALSFSAHVLRAQIASTAGDADGAAAALRSAIALEPESELSTRRVPPAIAALHGELRSATIADRAAWQAIGITVDAATGPIAVEIDGRPGQRRVPPGQHFVVVRRPGRQAQGFVADAGSTITVGEAPEILHAGLPTDRVAAEAICERTAVASLVLAQQKGPRLALEGYLCGQGFGSTWYSEPYPPRAATAGPPEAELLAGVRRALIHRNGQGQPTSTLAAQQPWPAPVPKPDRVVQRDRGDGAQPPPPRKPWFRRVWVWALIGGVVAAGVTTGAVLGTREQPSEIRIDVESF